MVVSSAKLPLKSYGIQGRVVTIVKTYEKLDERYFRSLLRPVGLQIPHRLFKSFPIPENDLNITGQSHLRIALSSNISHSTFQDAGKSTNPMNFHRVIDNKFYTGFIGRRPNIDRANSCLHRGLNFATLQSHKLPHEFFRLAGWTTVKPS